MVRYVKDADSDENGAVLENNCPAKEKKHNKGESDATRGRCESEAYQKSSS